MLILIPSTFFPSFFCLLTPFTRLIYLLIQSAKSSSISMDKLNITGWPFLSSVQKIKHITTGVWHIKACNGGRSCFRKRIRWNYIRIKRSNICQQHRRAKIPFLLFFRSQSFYTSSLNGILELGIEKWW